MTSISLVYNKKGLAIAADSAGSLPNGKVFMSNKIHRISDKYPLGVATYGMSEIGGMPRELAVKMFRMSNATNQFETLESCRDSFISFLESNENVNYTAHDILANLIHTIIQVLTKRQGSDEDEIIDSAYLEFQALDVNDFLPDTDVTEIMDVYDSLPDSFFGQYVGLKIKIRHIVELCLQKKVFIGSIGLIFMGYGDADVFPKMSNIEIHAKYNGIVYYDEKQEISEGQKSGIHAFAQSEAIETIVKGASPSMLQCLDGILTNQQQINRIKGIVGGNIDRMRETVMHLSLDEMASMVETFVNLETFKKRMTEVNETVGGPTDVAVISKCDGFIRIKRKHYFEKDSNLHFVKNYCNV